MRLVEVKQSGALAVWLAVMSGNGQIGAIGDHVKGALSVVVLGAAGQPSFSKSERPNRLGRIVAQEITGGQKQR